MTTVQTCVRCLPIGACSQGCLVGVEGYPVFFPLHRVEDQSLLWGRRISLVHRGLGITPNFEGKVKVFTSPFLLPFRETNRTREAVLLAQRPKGTLAFEFLEARNGSRSLPVRISPHPAQPPLSFRQDRVIELAARFQMGAGVSPGQG